jgi:hypothetical protein
VDHPRGCRLVLEGWSTQFDDLLHDNLVRSGTPGLA